MQSIGTRILLVWLACGSLSLAAEPIPELRQLVADLGSGDFDVRERAMKEIGRFGDEAIAPLEQAARSPDAEVRYRAAILLEEVRSGISRDLPEEVRILMLQYRQENVDKQAVIRRLSDLSAWRQVRALVEGEKDEAMRSMLRRVVSQISVNKLQELSKDENFDDMQLLLETASASNFDRSRLVLYLYSRGTLRDYAERLRERLETRYDRLADREKTLAALLEAPRLEAPRKTDDAEACLLIASYKALGETKTAEQWAIRTGQIQWVEQLALERGDWKLAAAFRKKNLLDQPRHQVYLGPSLVLMNLAEDRAERERIAQLLENPPPPPMAAAGAVVPHNSVSIRVFLNAGLAAGRIEEALAFAKKHVPIQSAELRLYRHEFETALAELGLAEPGEITLDRFEATIPADREPNVRVTEFFLRVPVALQAFENTGRSANYRELMAIARAKVDLLPVTETQRMMLRQNIHDWELGPNNSRGKEANIAEILLDRYEEFSTLPRELFRDLTPVATAWWNDTASRDFPSKQARLAWVRSLLTKSPERRPPPADWREHVERITSSEATSGAEANKLLHAGAETAVLRGDLALAIKIRVDQAERLKNPQMRVIAGDLAVKLGDWKQAAEHYGKAAEHPAVKTNAAYLQGVALERSGDQAAGEQVKHKALLRLAQHPPSLEQLASFLTFHRHPEEAAKIYRLQLALLTPEQHFPSSALQFLGNEASRKKDPESLIRWEQLLYALGRPEVSVSDIKAYLDLSLIRCREACRKALREKDFAAAERWFTEAVRLVPAHVATHEKLIPLFDAAEQRETADRFFRAAHDRLSELLKTYPESNSLKNNLAWMSARCNRELPAALRLAQEAVAAEPERTMYRDTLAEVLFRLGRNEEAIAEGKKCLAADPENEFYAKQLARFTSGKSDDLPDETP